MISGSDLRNSFNLTMRKLYSVKDSSTGSATGRHGNLGINSKTYVDIYIEKCYDLLDKYDKYDEISETQINKFLDEISSNTCYFLQNQISEKTRDETKKLIKEYFNQIETEYDSKAIENKIKTLLNEISNTKEAKIDNFSLNDSENSKGIKFDKGYFKTEETQTGYENIKQSIKDNNKQKEVYSSKSINNKVERTTPEFEKAKETFKKHGTFEKEHKNEVSHNKKETKEEIKTSNSITKIILIALVLVLFFGGTYYFYNNSNSENLINDTNTTLPVVDEKIDKPLEKPVAPILDEFQLTLTEKELLNLINKKRVQYGKSELKLNLKLSELLKDHTIEMSQTNNIASSDSKGSVADRAKQSNVTLNIIESNQKIEVIGSNISEEVFNKISNNNLYLEKYSNIGLSLTEGESNTYYLTIDLY